MSHPDLELLLTGVDHAPDDVLRHVAACPTCQDDLATIRRARAVGDLLRSDPAAAALTPPPPEVWDAIQRELARDDGDVGPTADPSADPSPDLSPDLSPDPSGGGDATVVPLAPRRTRRSPWGWVAAAAVGAVLGSGLTWAVTGGGGDDTTTTATSALAPLDGHDTSGTISLSGTGSSTQLSLDVSGVPADPGFVEVWLLDAKTGGMVALGVLDGDHGSFAVPPGLDLSAYDQVDVSKEPYDGDPAHSTESLARGRLP